MARPKKSLSQNFLKDESIIQKIVELANIAPVDTVVEIGPGTGALTRPLLNKCNKVIAIEKDDRLISDLRQDFPVLHLVHADILDVDFSHHVSGSAKLVSNLPYQLTSPILEKVLPRHDLFETATLMMQLEVAKRIVARPGTRDYSSLSIFAQVYSTPTLGFTVSREAFFPVPKVDSAVVHFKLHPPKVNESLPLFFKLVKTAFSQRRKMVRKTLKEHLPQDLIEKVLIAHGMPADARPERLSIECFLALTRVKEKEG